MAKRTRKPAAAAPVDPRFQKKWLTALKAFKAAERQGQRAFDERWEIVGDIVDHDPPLYLAAGYPSRAAFFREVVREKPRTAERYVRVARFASPNEELRYGVSKLDAALDFIERRKGPLVKGRVTVDFQKLRIPVIRDGNPKRLPLEEATVAEVREATATLEREESAASPFAQSVARALKEARLDVTVRSRGKTVTLSGIRSDNVGKVAAVLSKLSGAA